MIKTFLLLFSTYLCSAGFAACEDLKTPISLKGKKIEVTETAINKFESVTLEKVEFDVEPTTETLPKKNGKFDLDLFNVSGGRRDVGGPLGILGYSILFGKFGNGIPRDFSPAPAKKELSTTIKKDGDVLRIHTVWNSTDKAKKPFTDELKVGLKGDSITRMEIVTTVFQDKGDKGFLATDKKESLCVVSATLK